MLKMTNENERVQFFKSKVEEHFSEEYNILMGDFNCTLNDTDRCGGVQRKEVGRTDLEALMKRHELYDVYRKRHPEGNSFTYFKPNSTIRSRIDFIMLNEIMDVWVQDIRMLTAVFSDHNAVKVRLKIGDEARGAGRWKMSKNVITSKLFKETFTSYWKTWRDCKDEFRSKSAWCSQNQRRR